MTEDTQSNTKPVILGGVVAVLIGLGIFVAMPASELSETPEPEVVAAPAAQDQVALVPTPAPETDAAVEVTEDTVPDIVAAAPTPPAAPLGPQFDTFRVDPNGAMVIAGRADPGQVVDIILGGDAIDRVTADAGGSFVALPLAGPSEQPRRLSLLADPDGAAIPSETSYIVAPIAAPVIAAAPAEAVPEVAETTALAEATVPAAPTIETVAPPPPTVLEADAEGVRVVQGGVTAATDNVALDAITYDPEGEVQLAGRAVGDGAVQVYIDNQPITASPVTQGGDWQIALPEIETGVYTLRIDEVDAEGDVVSRLETPFKREEPAEVAAVLAEETQVDGFEVAVKTVQPGATLWAIAEENLGSGIRYIEVYEANADLIRDPDLIYPGQIFRMPDITE